MCDQAGGHRGGGKVLFASVHDGVGRATDWLANSYARVTKLAALASGLKPSSGERSRGMPTFSRGSAASWQDEDNRWWLASNGLARAGDPKGIRLAAGRTPINYLNVNPADGATWLGSSGRWNWCADRSFR